MDRNPAATATWQRAHEGARFGHIALPTEEAAVAPVRRQFDTLEAEFAAQWYPQLTALRNEIVNRAKTAARVTSLIGAAKQLTVSSLLNPADTVTFPLDSAFAGFRKQLQTALDAARAQSETDDKRLADARRLLEKKREHSRLVDERKRAVEARVASARGKSGNSSAFKEALSDALLQAVFEVEVGRTAFDAVILIHVRPNGRLALHNELAASLPKTVANAVHSFFAATTLTGPEHLRGKFLEGRLTFADQDLGFHLATLEVSPSGGPARVDAATAGEIGPPDGDSLRPRFEKERPKMKL